VEGHFVLRPVEGLGRQQIVIWTVAACETPAMAIHRWPSVLIVVLTIVVLAVHIEQSSAKRGCSAFGHSCFGGHGKRADEGVLLIPGPDSDQQSRLVFPPTAAAAGSEGSDDAVIQTGGFGTLSASPSEPWVPSQHNLSPFLRQWLQSYQRSADDIEVK